MYLFQAAGAKDSVSMAMIGSPTKAQRIVATAADNRSRHSCSSMRLPVNWRTRSEVTHESKVRTEPALCPPHNRILPFLLQPSSLIILPASIYSTTICWTPTSLNSIFEVDLCLITPSTSLATSTLDQDSFLSPSQSGCTNSLGSVSGLTYNDAR